MSEWQKVKIGDVCTITKGVTGIQKAVAGEYPMVTLAEERTTHNEFQFDCEAVIVPLVSSTGHGHASMKRVHYQEGKFAIGSILCAVVPNDTEFLNPKYLHIYLSYLKDKLLVPLMRGAANVSLSISNIKTVEVIVPPIERQLEIIELEKVLRNQKGKLDEQNSFQQSHLTLLRQQILQDAISGKLTADWRAENPNTESASKLLEQIKAEKEKLIAEKKIRKEKALPPISEDEVLFELPKGWEWSYIGSVCEIKGGKRVPKGYSLSKDPTSHVYIRILDMKEGGVNENDLAYINDQVFEIIKNYTISSEDLYVTIAGTIGQVGIIPESLSGSNLTENAAKLCNIGIDKDFLKYVVGSLIVQNQFQEKRKGAAQPKLALKRIANTIFPLPPRAEQRAIVAKVERLMGYVSQLEEKIAQNANSAEILMQAFLGEVFRK